MKYAVCYNTLYVFENAMELKKHFTKCYYWSEGAEQQRYAAILIDSNSGAKISKDLASEDCREIIVRNNEYSNQSLNIDLDNKLSIEETVDYYEKIINPILQKSKEYDVNFNRKMTFDGFGDDEESEYGVMRSFSNYYKEILEKLNANIDNIETKIKSDGKYLIVINDKHIFETSAWEKIDGVIDNVKSMMMEIKLKENDITYE